MPKLEPYDKRADYSYCLGLYPCHALLDSRPGAVQRLLLHPDGLGSEGVEKLRGRCAELGVREEMAERVGEEIMEKITRGMAVGGVRIG